MAVVWCILSRISLKTIFTFSESPGAASDGMLRALGFGCCASAPVDGFFVFFGRGAAYSILARSARSASLVSLRRRDVRLLHSVLGRFHLSFSREKLPHRWQELKLECLWLKMEAVWASSPQTLPKKQESRLPSVLHAASLRAARHSRVRAWWTYRPRQLALTIRADHCVRLASRRLSARRLYKPGTAPRPLCAVCRARGWSVARTAPRDRSALAQPLRTVTVTRLASQAPGRE